MASPSTDRRYGLNPSIAIKAPVKVATTAAITLSGEQTIDGIACVSGDRVLVANQTDATLNGIYNCDTGNWDRAADFNSNRDVTNGTIVKVNEGSFATSLWQLVTTDPVVFGTSTFTFANTNWQVMSHADYTAVGGEGSVNTGITYVIGSSTLAVFRNGLRQDVGVDYTESSTTTVTFTALLSAGDEIAFYCNQYAGTLVLGAVNADAVTFAPDGAGAQNTSVQAKLRESVSVLDFGAVEGSSAAAAANTLAIQAALDTGNSVKVPAGIYYISGVVRFKAHGQILKGEGSGDNSTFGVTVLRYNGAANGKMISWYDGSVQHWGNGGVQDMLIDGGGLANIGLEMYDDTDTAGMWRARVKNVFIYGVSNGTTPTAIYAGAGTVVANANDFVLDHVTAQGSEYGLVSGGGMGSLIGRCTIASNSVAGVKLTAGAAISLGDTTFSANGFDIKASGAQLVSAVGAWFENSTTAIYQSDTAHNLSLTGCLLHTSGATLLDFGSSAGYHALVGNYISAVTNSSLVINVNQNAIGVITGNPVTATYVTSNLPVPALVAQPTFTSLATLLQNSWVDYGGAVAGSAYWLDPQGVVHLRGAIKSGTAADGTLLFTLPAGNRPSTSELFPVVSNKAFAAVVIAADGTVKLEGAADATYLSLSGITFKTSSSG